MAEKRARESKLEKFIEFAELEMEKNISIERELAELKKKESKLKSRVNKIKNRPEKTENKPKSNDFEFFVKHHTPFLIQLHNIRYHKKHIISSPF